MAQLTQLVLLGEEHSGRDEMNLAGNPFALLQPAQKSSQKVIVREWDRTLPDGRLVKASWEVAGHPKLGLPGPSEEMLLLVLMQLSREAVGNDGGWPKTVQFSRYALLARMGWPDTAQGYRALTDGFQRLTSVNINARYAFFDAQSKLPVKDANFHILESSDLVDEPKGRKGEKQLPLSWFSWSDRMHESFLAGNVRSLALEFVLRLELPLSRRLFRFLDMMRWAVKPPRREFCIGVMLLRDRLGMTPYAYASKVKEKLEGAHKELSDCGYIGGIDYRKGTGGELLVEYHFGPNANKAISEASSASATDALAARDDAEPASARQGAIEAHSSLSEGLGVTLAHFDEDSAEQVALDAACDRIFEALPAQEQAKVLARAHETLGSYLRAHLSTPGARSHIEKERRAIVWSDNRAAVYAQLREDEPA